MHLCPGTELVGLSKTRYLESVTGVEEYSNLPPVTSNDSTSVGRRIYCSTLLPCFGVWLDEKPVEVRAGQYISLAIDLHLSIQTLPQAIELPNRP